MAVELRLAKKKIFSFSLFELGISDTLYVWVNYFFIVKANKGFKQVKQRTQPVKPVIIFRLRYHSHTSGMNVLLRSYYIAVVNKRIRCTVHPLQTSLCKKVLLLYNEKPVKLRFRQIRFEEQERGMFKVQLLC